MKILHVIGTGPGASDLLTIRAARLLQNTRLIFAAASSTRDYSSCLDIAKPWLDSGARCVRLDFPMTFNKTQLEEAWEKASKTCLEEMKNEDSAVFLTLGDPLIYSTSIYLLRSIEKHAPDMSINIVPGISAFQAAAACYAQPLCEGRNSLRIISGTDDYEKLENALAGNDCIIILKVYRNCEEIVSLLRKTGRYSSALLASQVEQAGQEIYHSLDDRPKKLPYMTLIISPARKRGMKGC